VSQTAIPCTLMRGGTSKGPFFLERDLPLDPNLRDRVLVAALGADARQIDGVGGADPLTSKVAIVSRTTHPEADVDYLFAQVVVGEDRVDVSQNCGNMLAAVGPFAIDRGLVAVTGDVTDVRIHMLNTRSLAIAHVETPDGAVRYDGDARIDGVPGTAAPVRIDFLDIAGGSCGALLPTGNVRDRIGGIDVTLVDNGMPVVIMRASDFALSGRESPADLEANAPLRDRVEAIRREAAYAMHLGDIAAKNVPKMCLVAAPQHGGSIATRTFIPHRVHKAIGVFGAVSVATACALPGSVAAEIAGAVDVGERTFDIEHPSGYFTVEMQIARDDGAFVVRRSALVRTARALMRGELYIPRALWEQPR
jgi:4-oxalomesaconate tautomerase